MSSSSFSRVIGFVLLGVCVGAVVWIGLRNRDSVESTLATDTATSAQPPVTDLDTTTTAPPTLATPPENFGPRLGLENLDGWLNTDISSLDDLDGQVVLVEMWTFGCRNCKARIPHNQELYATYANQGFEIVGVHAPEFDHEADIGNIEEAIERLGVTWPVALDTDKTNFRAWQSGGRRFWPRTFLIDQNGDIRYDHIGEGKYAEVAQTVAWLLDNPPA